MHAADLRFSLADAELFLRQALPFPLSLDTIMRLYERTEGWEAGLRLATLALQEAGEQQGIERFLACFTGSHKPLLEYLFTDVLSSQAEPH